MHPYKSNLSVIVMKRIHYILNVATTIVALFAVFLLASCGGNQKNDQGLSAGKGGVYYGGVFRMNEVEDFRNLFPLNVTEVTSERITRQVYEGLVKLNQNDLTIIPGLAEKWEKNENATVWTFHLRKGIKFHDDACFPEGKGRDVTAKDFKYCYDKLCEASPENQQYVITFKDRVIGANDYFQSTIDDKPLAEGVSGVKVIDDYTLEIDLKYSFGGFLNILVMPGCWLYPKEAFDKYGIEMRVKCVGTGPFKVKSIKSGESVVLEKNANYWNVDESGNQMPYLDGVKYSFIKEKKSEFLEFRKGNLDMIFRLPTEMIPEILGDIEHAKNENTSFDIQIVPAMSTNFYGFQNQGDLFNNKQLRQAFNYAIDREKIVTYTLQGEGVPAMYGIVPPSFKGYDYKSIHGFIFDPAKAKQLLAEAGYPNGKGFPKITLQINSGGGERIPVAEVIQKMLKENLNIDVDINVIPFAENLESIESGKAIFWRAGWSADYPDPETFLTCYYGRHIPKNLSDRSSVNSVRYKSHKFDSLFTLAMEEVDTKKRFELYKEADQVAIDDAAIMPLFYDENYRLVQKYVRNFSANAMEYRDLSVVYFVPKDEMKDKK